MSVKRRECPASKDQASSVKKLSTKEGPPTSPVWRPSSEIRDRQGSGLIDRQPPAGVKPFPNQPVVLVSAGLCAPFPQVEISSAECDNGLSCWSVTAVLGDAQRRCRTRHSNLLRQEIR